MWCYPGDVLNMLCIKFYRFQNVKSGIPHSLTCLLFFTYKFVKEPLKGQNSSRPDREMKYIFKSHRQWDDQSDWNCVWLTSDQFLLLDTFNCSTHFTKLPLYCVFSFVFPSLTGVYLTHHSKWNHLHKFVIYLYAHFTDPVGFLFPPWPSGY